MILELLESNSKQPVPTQVRTKLSWSLNCVFRRADGLAQAPFFVLQFNGWPGPFYTRMRGGSGILRIEEQVYFSYWKGLLD